MPAVEYRKKPHVVSAIQFDGTNQDEVVDWVQAAGAVARHDEVIGFAYGRQVHQVITIKSPGGTTWAVPGSYVVKGVEGEFYERQPDAFYADYEPV